jgi:hypothetical protein
MPDLAPIPGLLLAVLAGLAALVVLSVAGVIAYWDRGGSISAAITRLPFLLTIPVGPQAPGPAEASTSSTRARISVFSGMSLMLCP